MPKNNFYDEKIRLIQSKIESNPDLALKLVKEELDMPYIPSDYESKFLEIYFKIGQTQKMGILNNNLSIDDAFDIIMSNGPRIHQAIQQLSDYNLSANTYRLKKVFNSDIDISIMAVIYELAVKQKINENFKIKNNVLNPSIDNSFLDTKENITTFDMFNKNVIKNPTLLNICKSIFNDYLMKIFPKFNNEILFEEILYIASKSLGLEAYDEINMYKVSEIKKVLDI